MNANPLDIRLALQQRFPAWTQPFWTYLTALTPPGAPRRLRWTEARHLWIWLLAYTMSATVGIVSAAVLIDAAASGLIT